MDGTLNNPGLLDVIATLTSRGESGRLQITAAGSRGAFFFKKGRLVDARMGPFSGFPAVNLAVSIGEATLKFDSSIQPPASSFIDINERVLLRERFGIETIDLEPVEDQTTEIDGAKLSIHTGETQRIADQFHNQTEEESRTKVEKEKSFERAHYVAQEEKPGQTPAPAITPESSAMEIRTHAGTKRCPKCSRVYSDYRIYCRYDSTQLVSESDPSFDAAAKREAATRPALFWTLITITLFVSGVLGYLLNSYISRESAPTPIRAESEQPSNVDQDQPVVEGLLHGKETTLIKPDYPARAKSEGVAGKVTVAVLVNKQGLVVSARALNGHPLLKVAAVVAARKAKFSPEKLADQRSKISGTITYSFKL